VKRTRRKKKTPPKIGLNVDECINPKFKMGKNAPKLTKQIHLANQRGLRVIKSIWLTTKRLRFMVEEVAKGGDNQWNGFRVELELKSSKV